LPIITLAVAGSLLKQVGQITRDGQCRALALDETGLDNLERLLKADRRASGWLLVVWSTATIECNFLHGQMK
jgi:hypothetical protein